MDLFDLICIVVLYYSSYQGSYNHLIIYITVSQNSEKKVLICAIFILFASIAALEVKINNDFCEVKHFFVIIFPFFDHPYVGK